MTALADRPTTPPPAPARAYEPPPAQNSYDRQLIRAGVDSGWVNPDDGGGVAQRFYDRDAANAASRYESHLLGEL